MVNRKESDDILIDVRFDPVMQVAVDLLHTFVKGRRMILKATGDAIPNAVAVANILTEGMIHDARVENITVDSDAPPGIGKMTSTIAIILTRNQ